MLVNNKAVVVDSVAISGINYDDTPDFCDAFIESGFFQDGTPLSDDDIECIHDNFPNEVYNLIYNCIY